MDNRRLILWSALAIVGLLLVGAWQRDHQAIQTDSTNTPSVLTQNNSTPFVSTENLPTAQKENNNEYIHINTDVFSIVIDKQGGKIIEVKLLNYPETLKSTSPVVLLTEDPNQYYTATSGLTGNQGPDTPAQGAVNYQADKNDYRLQEGQDSLRVNLYWQGKNGLSVIKSYTFKRGNYAVLQQYEISNHGASAWSGREYMQLIREEPKKNSSILHYALFTGAAISSPDTHYEKFSFDQLAENKLDQNIQGGWAAMVQHYFLSAWVPNTQQNFKYYSSQLSNGYYALNLYGPEMSVAPGKTLSTQATFYAGPAIAKNLDAVAPYLSMTIDYGWLWFISKLLFWIMLHLYQIVGNWGLSIILLTIVIKLAFFHLSTKSYRSMAHMRRLQPRMQQLKERFGDDKQAFGKAMMELYKKEKVNPLGGCLPMLIQIPFFIALYYMIIESVELRQAPFIFWIQDLSVADPYFVLPILMGLFMFLQQRLSPPAPDPMQQKVMMFLPVMFTVFFLSFPAGLVLYWITNTAFGIVHQWWCNHSVAKYESTHSKAVAKK